MNVTASLNKSLPLKPKKISILGSTGSIGCNTLDLIKHHPDNFIVHALVAGQNATLLAAQAKQVKARVAVIADETQYFVLKELLAGSGTEVFAGEQAIIDIAAEKVDLCVSAIVGAAGLKPTLSAIQSGANIALANKECLVCAGSLFMEQVSKHGVTLLPVDSEHNAIFQVFSAEQKNEISRIILTASGGPFREREWESLHAVTPEQAVAHPNWSMGAKISVDSATMMNKALEIIEAHYLFDMPAEKISVLIHPQSIIHSMVEYIDGSILAQLGASDMRTPIIHALAWPHRMETSGQKLDFSSGLNLGMYPVDFKRFQAVKMAFDALQDEPGVTTVINAANEIAVDAFLNRKIKFTEIEKVVSETLFLIDNKPISTLEDVFALDQESRHSASGIVKRI